MGRLFPVSSPVVEVFQVLNWENLLLITFKKTLIRVIVFWILTILFKSPGFSAFKACYVYPS